MIIQHTRCSSTASGVHPRGTEAPKCVRPLSTHYSTLLANHLSHAELGKHMRCLRDRIVRRDGVFETRQPPKNSGSSVMSGRAEARLPLTRGYPFGTRVLSKKVLPRTYPCLTQTGVNPSNTSLRHTYCHSVSENNCQTHGHIFKKGNKLQECQTRAG